MTREQKKAVRRGLRAYGKALEAGTPGDVLPGWAAIVERTTDYYSRHDRTCSELLRLRYLERKTEDETVEALYVCRSTYYRKELDALSTVAVYAAAAGLIPG